MGEWQAQGLGGCAGGLEAGVGEPRGAQSRQLSEMTLGISRRGGLTGAGSRGDGNMCPEAALPGVAPPGLYLPSQLSPFPGLRFLRAPLHCPPWEAERQISGQSSAPDTRWLRGSARFFKSSGFLSPSRWWAPRCLSSAGCAGSPGGLAQGHGTAPGPVLPVTSFQAKRG